MFKDGQIVKRLKVEELEGALVEAATEIATSREQ